MTNAACRKEVSEHDKTGAAVGGADDSDLLDCDEQRWPLHQTATYLGKTVEECEARLEELKPKS